MAETGDRLSVVDLVIWRFAMLCSDYTQWSQSSNQASVISLEIDPST